MSRRLAIAAAAVLLAAAAVLIGVRASGGDGAVEVGELPTATADLVDRKRAEREMPGPWARAGAEREGRPNVIVMTVDDGAMVDYERGLPRTRELLGAGGTEFTDALVSTPLCCPARATFLSGRYAHNHGIVRNDPGYPKLDDKRQVLPVWLKRAGYRTAMVGKFMNGYDREPREGPAPGWDGWVAMERTFAYYDYELTVGDRRERYGSARGDYLTDVLTDHGLQAIEQAADSPEPLFMWMSWWAPHPENSESTGGPCRGSAIPAEREPARHDEERLRDVPSVDENDIRDKPTFIRRNGELRPHQRDAARMSLRCRIASLEAVDRGVEAIIARLDELDELDDTVLIFTSDNGFFHLEHRLIDGKGLPYEEAVRVPLLVDAPRSIGRQRESVDVQVSNIDIAPTILDLVGARPCVGDRCARLDGRSLVPLLSPGDPDDLRERDLLIESGDGRPCPFRAIRTRGHKYAEYERLPDEEACPGEAELYDRAADPHEVDNLLHRSTSRPPQGEPAALRRKLRRLETCAGTRNDRDPRHTPCD